MCPLPQICMPSRSPSFPGSLLCWFTFPAWPRVCQLRQNEKSRRCEARRSGLMSSSCPSQALTTSWKLRYSICKMYVIIISFSRWLQGLNKIVQITKRQNHMRIMHRSIRIRVHLNLGFVMARLHDLGHVP